MVKMYKHTCSDLEHKGCLKNNIPSKRPLFYFIKLQTSYQSKCYIFEKYTLQAMKCQKIFSIQYILVELWPKWHFNRFSILAMEAFLNFLPMVDWCFHVSFRELIDVKMKILKSLNVKDSDASHVYKTIISWYDFKKSIDN